MRTIYWNGRDTQVGAHRFRRTANAGVVALGTLGQEPLDAIDHLGGPEGLRHQFIDAGVRHPTRVGPVGGRSQQNQKKAGQRCLHRP